MQAARQKLSEGEREMFERQPDELCRSA
jgi:hypothetical protein